ncbi:uncharacterized protein VP01_1537g5, partial [Puccinia sorghi]
LYHRLSHGTCVIAPQKKPGRGFWFQKGTGYHPHLKIIPSVGMKFQGPDCNVKESLIAENIVLKLPEIYSSNKEFLYSKRPLTIELVKETLTNKQHTAMTATKSKSKRREYCSGRKHNPKSSHSEKDCWQSLRKPPTQPKQTIQTMQVPGLAAQDFDV